jgi:hypothetical protein
MNLLPDFIDIQPDASLIADVRKLAEILLHTFGSQLSPDMLEILAGILVTGTLNARSSEIERAATSSQIKRLPQWATAFYLALRLLAVTHYERQEKTTSGGRKGWYQSARLSLDTALKAYESTTP